VDTALIVLDWFGTAVFAASGALAGARKNMDIFGAVFTGAVTGIGDGTLRDLLLDHGPVFWIEQPVYVVICIAAALAVALAPPDWQRHRAALKWADALGLSVFTVIGAAIAERAGAPLLIGVLMGVITATFGGLLRDLLRDDVPYILRREIYATASLIGATLYLGLMRMEVSEPLATAAGILTVFALRALAIRLDLSLPLMRRDPDDDGD